MKKFTTIFLLAFAICISALSQDNQSALSKTKNLEFPISDYTPIGYLDNTYHSFIFNRSGIIRFVATLGVGFWCRRFPWPYGSPASRNVNYLSFIHLSVTRMEQFSIP